MTGKVTQFEAELAEVALDKDSLVTMGIFDGVHLGHRHLISHLKESARKRGLQSVVVTFRQHPREVLFPGSRISRLNGLIQKIWLLQKEKPDMVIALSFTPELADLSAFQVVSLLQKYLRMRGMVIGSDFTLGKKGEGNAHVLGLLGQELGFTVDVVPKVKLDSEIISSTVIRQALADGDALKASAMLGRRVFLKSGHYDKSVFDIKTSV